MAKEELTLAFRSSGRGKPVVMLHSLGLDGRMWDTNATALAAAGYRVLQVDARGHGQSPTLDEEVTLDDLARDVGRLLDRQKLERPHLVGFSMGGMIAMRLAAAKLPLRSLTLVSTSGEEDERRAQYEPMLELFRQMPPSIQGADMFLSMVFTSGWLREHPETQEHYRRICLESNRIGIYHASVAVVRRPTILDTLRAISAPTLILSGSLDMATPPVHAQRLADAIPQARLVTLEDTAHMLNEERPDDFSRHLIAHLKEHAS